MSIIESANLTPAEASQYLLLEYGIRLSVVTLSQMRWRGKRSGGEEGPSFYKANRSVLYPRTSLDSYAQARLRVLRRSTQDVGKAA